MVVVTEKVERYRFTIDVYALPFEGKQEERVLRLVESFMRALFPLGVAPNYPDVQVVEDGPFAT